MAIISSEKNNQTIKYIVFIDLDGTLITSNSGTELVRQAYKNGIMNNFGLIRAFYLSFLYRLNMKDPIKIINNMVLWVSGLSERTLLDLSSEVALQILIPSIRQEMMPEINMHKDKQAKIVILSSALKQICLEVGNHLGMDDIICSNLEVLNGYFTGHPQGRVCFGEEKAVRLKEYCEKNNSDLGETWYYGDSISDLPALRIVGHPVCVNPDRKLKKFARKKKWMIYHWH
jgi:putative phosphoserine phosphatase / 1-acylglycerol-3-phosphate O-acyltransferase